jgi:hypothetical protein
MPARPTRFVLIAIAALAATACASDKGKPAAKAAAQNAPSSQTQDPQKAGTLTTVRRQTGEAVVAAGTKTVEGVPGAVTAPLEIVGVTQEKIPASLASIHYVYNAYPPPDCSSIADELARLSVDLGRDYDDDAKDEKSLGRRAGEEAGDLIVDAIRGAAKDVVPFRSILSEASGAASLERRKARAIAAGYARRAYLKGLALGQGCLPPAAPLVITRPPLPDPDAKDAKPAKPVSAKGN